MSEVPRSHYRREVFKWTCTGDVSHRAIADERLRDQIDRAALPLFSQHALEAGGIGAG